LPKGSIFYGGKILEIYALNEVFESLLAENQPPDASAKDKLFTLLKVYNYNLKEEEALKETLLQNYQAFYANKAEPKAQSCYSGSACCG
jgi:hypothetical protein